MGKQLFVNLFSSTIQDNPLISTQTTLTLQSGTGAYLGTIAAGDYYLAKIHNGSAIEIIKITGRSGDLLTIERAQEGTTGISCAAGSTIEICVTAAGLSNFAQSPQHQIQTAKGADKPDAATYQLWYATGHASVPNGLYVSDGSTWIAVTAF